MEIPEPSEWLKKTWREGEREHDTQNEVAKIHAAQLEAFALLGIRSLGLTAVGGIAASLAFYSANYERLSTNPANLKNLNGILACLFIGLIVSLFCTLCAYMSQVCFLAGVWARTRTWQHPYVEETPASLAQIHRGAVWRIASIVAAVLSAVCLSVAGVSFLALAT